jgi:tRNA threonylcarbamoyladenosine biosynthesis protein TsaB
MILAIETSDIWLSVAFWDETKRKTLLEQNLELPAQHATLLASVVKNGQEFVRQTIKKALAFEEKISAVAVAVGPGSFTGLRIGLSFVQGFCFAHEIPVVGISNHQVLATQMKPCDQKMFTIIDARREEVYLAQIDFDAEGFPEIAEHSIVLKEKLPEVIPAGSLLVKPEFHELDSEIVRNLRVKGVTLHSKGQYNTRLLAELGWQKIRKFGPDDLKELEPMYIRPFAGVL